MRVISRKPIRAFFAQYPDAQGALLIWAKYFEQVSGLTSLADIKRGYSTSVDYFNKYYIFNICGNKYRLISDIDFVRNIVFVKAIWTHTEYDRNHDKLRKGTL